MEDLGQGSCHPPPWTLLRENTPGLLAWEHSGAFVSRDSAVTRGLGKPFSMFQASQGAWPQESQGALGQDRLTVEPGGHERCGPEMQVSTGTSFLIFKMGGGIADL